MITLLRLIRFPNLVIIALTMCGVRYWLIAPLWSGAAEEMETAGYAGASIGALKMSDLQFGLLLFSTLLIAAAGYIINDYFDTKTDRINRPEKVVVGRTISRRIAMFLHLFLSISGLLIAAVVALESGRLRLVSIQLFSIVALWFYSTHLKKQLLAGNILIAFLAALVPITTGIYEFVSGSLEAIETINQAVPDLGNILFRTGTYLVVGFALFAFLSNLIREIVKDIEDVQGDYIDGCRTLPVVIGETRARYIALAMVVFTMVLLGMIQRALWDYGLTLPFFYILLAIQVPFLVLTTRLWTARETEDYSRASLFCKIIIIAGVFSMLMFKLSA